MSHFFTKGFSVRQPAWHGLSDVLAEYPENWDEARKLGGLDWEPTYADLFVEQAFTGGLVCVVCAAAIGTAHHKDCEHTTARTTDLVVADQCKDETGLLLPSGSIIIRDLGDGRTLAHVPAEGHQAIIRDDTRAVLATPTDKYELIFHWQMGELLDAYTAEWRKAGATVNFETVNVIKGGAVVAVLVSLDEPFHVNGDDSPIYPYAALINYHNGEGACRLLPTSVRIVCWNTVKMAEVESNRTNQGIILRHAGNVADRLEDAKASLGTMRAEAEAWKHLADELAGINVTDPMVQLFIDDFIPAPVGASERTRNNRMEMQSQFKKLYYESPTMAGIQGNAYGLFQAAGEWLDHYRSYRSQDTYLARTMLTNESDKGKVMRRIRELVNA